VGYWGIKHITVPEDRYRKLLEVRQKLGARNWAEFVDRIYSIIMQQNSDLCSEKIKKILEVLQS